VRKEEIPQDPSSLNDVSRELCYAVDDAGKYTTALSTGWEVKASALGLAWADIHERAQRAKENALRGECSPIAYFMGVRLMDTGILASYTGYWKWQIRRHLRASVFNSLPTEKLMRYAKAFDVSLDELRSMHINDR
jgi:hypothetical protein